MRLRFFLVYQAFFIIAVSLLLAFGIAQYFGIEGNQLAESTVASIISSAISLTLAILVLGLPRKRSGGS